MTTPDVPAGEVEALRALHDCKQWLETILSEKLVIEPEGERHIAASIERADAVLEGIHGPFGYLVGHVDLDESDWRIEQDPVKCEGYFCLPIFTKDDPFTFLRIEQAQTDRLSSAAEENAKLRARVEEVEHERDDARQEAAYLHSLVSRAKHMVPDTQSLWHNNAADAIRARSTLGGQSDE